MDHAVNPNTTTTKPHAKFKLQTKQKRDSNKLKNHSKSSSLINIAKSYLQANFRHCVITVLIDDALGFLYKSLLGLRLPPVDQISFFVELSALVVKTVSDFVSDDEADSAVVHVFRTVVVEEYSLKNTGREFCKDLDILRAEQKIKPKIMLNK